MRSFGLLVVGVLGLRGPAHAQSARAQPVQWKDLLGTWVGDWRNGKTDTVSIRNDTLFVKSDSIYFTHFETHQYEFRLLKGDILAPDNSARFNPSLSIPVEGYRVTLEGQQLTYANVTNRHDTFVGKRVDVVPPEEKPLFPTAADAQPVELTDLIGSWKGGGTNRAGKIAYEAGASLKFWSDSAEWTNGDRLPVSLSSDTLMIGARRKFEIRLSKDGQLWLFWDGPQWRFSRANVPTP